MQTADPEVIIESRSGDSVTYRRSDGVRWRVTGKCDRRGFCLVGCVIDGTVIESVEHLNELAQGRRIDSELDVPLGPGYKNDCCPMTVEILDGD